MDQSEAMGQIVTTEQSLHKTTNQYTNNLTVLEIDQNDGSLSDVVAQVEIFAPTSIDIFK